MSQPSTDARAAILQSIRDHLAESKPHDHLQVDHARVTHDSARTNIAAPPGSGNGHDADVSLVELFRERLESVGGHCVTVGGKAEIADALHQILAELQVGPLQGLRIALSDAPLVAQLGSAIRVNAMSITPSAADLFSYDLGITTAQAGIAETGTLVLESESERHRLVSLLPPVHIAILEASDICLTLNEALSLVRRDGVMSRTITFITGPSRTADIELTLAIGVHGPKELYVIVNKGNYR